MKAFAKTSLALLVLGCAACSQRPEPLPLPEYQAQTRQLPPEPVYSRLSWAHLPQPTPPRAESGRARMLSPNLHFELRGATLKDAVESLAQAAGLQATVPDDVASKTVTLKTSGTAEKILSDIGATAGVRAEIDRQSRAIRVYSPHNPDYQDGLVRW